MENLRLEWLDPETLKPNPANWRRHPKVQRDALEAVIAEVGWAGALLYNERTERLIDGHLRQEISHDGPVPVLVGSWSEEQERLILVTLDPIAALAEAESDALAALLEMVGTESEAVQRLLERLAGQEIDYDDLWQGMPEFEQEDLEPKRMLKVYFADEEDIAPFAELVRQKITDRTKYIWYPKAEIKHMDKIYVDES